MKAELDELAAATDSGSRWRLVVTIAAVCVLTMLGVFGSSLLRAKAHQPAVTSTDGPMTLARAVEDLPANSWKAVPLTVPHDGLLEVHVGVAHGNALNVFVATSADMQQMRGDDVTTVRQFQDLGATNTKQFQREAQLSAGQYYLVLQDPTMAGQPVSPSAVSIRASLRR